jgi:oligopeptide transport system permease protein
LREIEFVQASRLLGAPVMRLVTKHIGPNLLGLVIIAWSARIPNVIASEAFLSLIGLGVEQPTPSWGNVVFDSARRLQVNPSQFFLPASVLGVTLLAFYLLGNSLRDAFDPKLRGRG